MTSKQEIEANLENGSTRYPISTSSEAIYDRLVGYGFARRYVAGKSVADIGWGEVGQGSRLLAETAGSVVGLTDSPEAASLASGAYSASNVGYQSVDLLELPYPEDHFDVVVALGVIENLEQPEGLVREARRVLKEDGMLVISTPDKQTNSNERNRRERDGRREMYVSEFSGLLKRAFGHVRIYRQGAVAGGFVFPASEKTTDAELESIRVSSPNPFFGAEPPTTRSVIAVCDGIEDTGREEQPYLLLDLDRRVFDECEERAEDAELLRDEIRQMQETEVQAFLDALKLQQSLAYVLRRYPVHLRNIIRLVRSESRMYRRLATPYRWLRGKNRDSG